MDFDTYSFSAQLLADITGVHLETAKRWKRAGKAPAHHAPFLSLRIDGNLGLISQPWEDWRLTRDGKLWTPEDVEVTPGAIRAIPYQSALIKELKHRLAEPQQWRLL